MQFLIVLGFLEGWVSLGCRILELMQKYSAECGAFSAIDLSIDKRGFAWIGGRDAL